MTIRLMAAATLAAAGVFGALPASAACSPKALSIPVNMEGLRPLVTLKVGGREGHFLLDSGSAINAINGKLAAEQKLKPMTVAGTGSRIDDTANTIGSGATGKETLSGLVVAPQVEFVGVLFKNVVFMATDRLDEDGILGQSTLHQFDVEYDLHRGMARLVKPEGCANTDMVYWAKPGAPFSKMPLDTSSPEDLHTRAAVYVNGVKLRALFDTGAPLTFITQRAAERAGVKTSDPGVKPLGVFNALDGQGRAWIGQFKSVKIGDEEVQDAPLEIGESASDFDILVGADFFLSHHVYVANSQNKIYFTYSGGPVFGAPQFGVAAPAAQK
jgi:predicted aspartyl protease